MINQGCKLMKKIFTTLSTAVLASGVAISTFAAAPETSVPPKSETAKPTVENVNKHREVKDKKAHEHKKEARHKGHKHKKHHDTNKTKTPVTKDTEKPEMIM